MKLALSGKAERAVDWAIDDLRAGKFKSALKRLCELRGLRHVPEMKDTGKKRSRVTTLPDGSVKVTGKTPVTIPARSETYIDPEKEARARDRAEHLGLISHADAARDRLRAERDAQPVTPIPKPHRRHVDKDRVAAFRALYTRCAVLRCQRENADPHHLWSRGNRGDDDWANLVPLCPGPGGHHDEIEDIGTEAFRTKYINRLTEEDSLKMRLSMVSQAAAKLADRPAIDLDAEDQTA